MLLPIPKKSFYQNLHINISVEDIGKTDMKKRLFTKNTWYDQLIHYIPDPLKNDASRYGKKL